MDVSNITDSRTDNLKEIVTVELLRNGMTRSELAQKITDTTGMFCDKAYLSRVLNGQRKPKRIIFAICKILSIDTNRISWS